jgi:O-antigen/teichoic acid export membrane protein
MLRYSVWIAVSNFIGPLMGYCDRVIIATHLGAVAVAYYVTPFDVITRTSIFAVAIAAVVFPAVAYVGQTAHRQVAAMMEKVELLVGAFALPAYFIVAAFAGDLLRLWISEEFATAGALPATLLCAGMFANSIARIPHAVIQGRGRADMTAMANLIELPIYFLGLFLLLPRFGLAGVAACWAGRALLDYVILRLIAGRLLQAATTRSVAESASVFIIVIFIACAGIYPLALKIAGIGITLCVTATMAYRFSLSPSKFFTLIGR